MTVIHNLIGFSNNDEMLCPKCQSNYITHHQVQIFDRREDDVFGVHILVENHQAIVDTNLKANPSTRRHGVSIRFCCENCGSSFLLTFAQHKGCTIVEVLIENN